MPRRFRAKMWMEREGVKRGGSRRVGHEKIPLCQSVADCVVENEIFDVK